MVDDKKTLSGTISFLTSEAFKYHQEGNLKEAKNIYEQILKHKPNHFDALQLLGILYGQINKKDKAIKLLELALQIKPDDAATLNNYGVILTEVNRTNDSYEALDKATNIKPDYAEAYSNKGNALKLLEKYDDAVKAYSKAIQLKPNYAEAYNNRGVIYKELSQMNLALKDLKKAISLKPDYPEANSTMGVTLLLTGNFSKGWEQYEWRWKDLSDPSVIRSFKQPLWDGKKSLKGKSILLYSEQGLGDTIQFSRYILLIKALGAKVILETHKELLNIVGSIDSNITIILMGQTLPHFDFQCPLLSLPLKFGTGLKNIPSPNRYIWADKRIVPKWKKKIGSQKKPLIGLAWEGNPLHKNDYNRSILLAELIPHLPKKYEYIGLQKDIRESNLKTLKRSSMIDNLIDNNVSMDDTAAIIENLDIVISVDTSVAHLSASMGKPTWILLPFVPDWRWLLNRNDSPWYKSVKLFRQEKRGNWELVFKDLNKKLNVLYQ
ncbi:tetratricopeptide repeat protein [Methylophilaceae bacterium]|nr:tetratricopeptide repeat protein [Methylophilaceae bacterium]